MTVDKTLLSGSTSPLILKLLQDGDKYGYQMIEELRRRSDDTFALKAGTLYPLLHSLEQQGFITAWEEGSDAARSRRYYHLTDAGAARLTVKEAEWRAYAGAMLRVLQGGAGLA